MRTVLYVAGLALTVALAACGNKEEEVTPEPADETPPERMVVGGEPERIEVRTPTKAVTVEAHQEEVAEPTDVVTEPNFELRLTSSGPYAAGTAATFAIALTPSEGWHVNQEYPMRVELTAPAGIALAKAELAREDAAEFVEERARFDVGFTPSAAGEHRVTAKVDFAVCTDQNCVPDERTLALVLPVQ
jgi:hypothetical protein